ncbi:hypothetical protein M4I21_12090 [Cellulophaga sp. 20_2_10]|uniref:hypothetical protein n=1 Tax=Cellulophaga sp. 20_2_10 TaxID=2942476 RepID=UPI00201A5865|nr:hypothetical protein [Cellulophaga sp. 20_2_10]MCL5246555.1 hypothetical protein [Cellulophaga sp. 20_2_10]
MKSFKSVLYRIVLLIVFSLLAKSCVTDYVYKGDKDKIEQRQQMLDDNTFVIADLSSEYTETTVARVVKTYKFNYSFTVDNRFYTDEISLTELPSFPKLKLYYLKDDPNVISKDPQGEIASENKKGDSITDLLVGIVWGILAALILLSFFGKSDKKEQKIATQTKESATTNTTTTAASEEKIGTKEERKAKEDPNRFMPK